MQFYGSASLLHSLSLPSSLLVLCSHLLFYEWFLWCSSLVALSLCDLDRIATETKTTPTDNSRSFSTTLGAKHRLFLMSFFYLKNFSYIFTFEVKTSNHFTLRQKSYCIWFTLDVWSCWVIYIVILSQSKSISFILRPSESFRVIFNNY